MKPHILSPSELDTALQKLNTSANPTTTGTWQLAGNTLHKQFQFINFVDAFTFMTKVAFIAESLNHHPQWSNVYSRVSVDLITHSQNAITTLDIQLAEKMDAVFRQSHPS